MMRSLLTAAILVAAPISSVLAQGESENALLQARCRQFVHYLEIGPRQPHYEEALSGITMCDETGGAALAAAWSRMTAADSIATGRLIYTSSRFRDRTLLGALLTQVADAARPRRLRIGILMVLVSYYAPGRSLPPNAREEGVNPKWCVLGGVTDFDAADGASPLTPADPPRILTELQSLASEDPDSVFRGTLACTVAAMELESGT